jgi:catechol 2,3-dioxygenase-like lactoylglutathione lyase family enzyme
MKEEEKNMKYTCPLLVVDDIAESRKFYEDLLNLSVIVDFGANITFGDVKTHESLFALQSKASWIDFISKKESEIILKNNSFEIVFEEENFDDFMARLKKVPNLELVHDVIEYPWAQHVIRFYDPSKNIIEVGESMRSIAKRFLAEGLTVEETAKRIMHPIEFVQSCVD